MEIFGTQRFRHGIARHLRPGRIEKSQPVFFVQLEDDLIDIFHYRSVFLFVFSGLGIKPGTGDGNINMVTQGFHQHQVLLRQDHTLDTFYIERAYRSILVKQRQTSFGYDSFYGTQERGIFPHIFEKNSFT